MFKKLFDKFSDESPATKITALLNMLRSTAIDSKEIMECVKDLQLKINSEQFVNENAELLQSAIDAAEAAGDNANSLKRSRKALEHLTRVIHIALSFIKTFETNK